MERLAWIFQVGPKCSHSAREEEGGLTSEGEEAMWPEPQTEVIHCGKAISWGIREGSLDAGKGKETFSPGASKRNQLCQQFDF